MNQATVDRVDRQRRLHGGVLLFALAISLSSDRLRAWPLYLLVPLAVYGVIVCAVPSLRGSAEWLKAGTIDRTVLTFTLLLALAAPAALLCFQRVFQPSLPNFREQLPTIFWSHPLLGILVFSATNALLEEVVFRGVLQDALVSALGVVGGVVVQGVIFGLSHAAGYPPGAGGVALAAIYGILLGVLKIRSRGLAAPILAHFFADATIFAMVLQSGLATFFSWRACTNAIIPRTPPFAWSGICRAATRLNEAEFTLLLQREDGERRAVGEPESGTLSG